MYDGHTAFILFLHKNNGQTSVLRSDHQAYNRGETANLASEIFSADIQNVHSHNFSWVIRTAPSINILK